MGAQKDHSERHQRKSMEQKLTMILCDTDIFIEAVKRQRLFKFKRLIRPVYRSCLYDL
jgi:hypothetical protein